MKRIPLDRIKVRAKLRPPGYEADLLSRGVVRDGFLELSDEAAMAVADKYNLPLPPLHQRLKNFSLAFAKHIAAGFPIVAEEVLKDRAQKCQACPYWRGDEAEAKCSLCGCRELKLEWAGERCPDKPPRWVQVA